MELAYALGEIVSFVEGRHVVADAGGPQRKDTLIRLRKEQETSAGIRLPRIGASKANEEASDAWRHTIMLTLLFTSEPPPKPLPCTQSRKQRWRQAASKTSRTHPRMRTTFQMMTLLETVQSCSSAHNKVQHRAQPAVSKRSEAESQSRSRIAP